MSYVFQLLKIRMTEGVCKYLPIKLTIALTFLCNSGCKTCGIWKVYLENPEKLKMEATINEWKKLFDEIGSSLMWIEFTGGEPTLRKDCSEIVSYAYNKTKIIAGGLTTNAVHPKRSLKVIADILNSIPENKILNVGISLDGLPKVHDELRGVKNNFKRAISLFQNLKGMQRGHPNLRVHLAYTISRYNVGKFREFYEYIKDNYGVENVTVTLEHFTEYYKNLNKDSVNSYDNLRNMITNDILYILRSKNKSRFFFEKVKQAFYQFYLKKMPEFISEPRKMIIPCVAGRYSAYIDPYGNVYPCTHWLVKLGNIREAPFKEIWWGKKAEEVRKLIKYGKCPNCWTPCEAQPSWIMNFGLLRGWW